MHRAAFSLVFVLGGATVALCQAPFTIVRPADGAKVREDVRVLIPKNSVPKTGYVGFFLDGKFLEAVVPGLSGRYYEYMLDTKHKNIEDGKHTLEAVLYVDYSDEPRIVDRSSVTLTVQNHANIPIPAGGFNLRYKFKPGTNLRYTVLQRIAKNAVSVNAAQLGIEGANLPMDYEKVRMNYLIENSYDNGDGLVRLQAEPLKNKSYAMYTPDGDTDPVLFWKTDFAPLYMRLTNTGFEVFGSVPQFIPFESIRNGTGPNFYANWPLPTLPTNKVKPGDVWPTRFQVGKRSIAGQTAATSVVTAYPARGEFKALEWEMGHPCAKIVNSITFGGKQAGGGTTPRVSLEETVWYALDKNVVIKVLREQQFDQTGQSVGGPAGGVTGRPDDSGTGGIRKRQPGATPPPASPRRGGSGGISLAVPQSASPLMQGTPGGRRRRGAAAGSGDAPPGRRNPVPPGGATNARPPSIPGGGTAIQRLAIEQIFILDQ
jgi:hypothetical protein